MKVRIVVTRGIRERVLRVDLDCPQGIRFHQDVPQFDVGIVNSGRHVDDLLVQFLAFGEIFAGSREDSGQAQACVVGGDIGWTFGNACSWSCGVRHGRRRMTVCFRWFLLRRSCYLGVAAVTTWCFASRLGRGRWWKKKQHTIGVTLCLTLCVHIVINRADFVSWWVWFNGSPTKIQRHFLTNAFCYFRSYITCTKIWNRPD